VATIYCFFQPQETAAPMPTRTMPARDFATLAKQFIPFQNRAFTVHLKLFAALGHRFTEFLLCSGLFRH